MSWRVLLGFILPFTFAVTAIGYFWFAWGSSHPSGSVDIVASVDGPGNQEATSHASSDRWISFAAVPQSPANLQIYTGEKEPGIVDISYDGSISSDQLLSPTDPRYPDPATIRISAFENSPFPVWLPTGIDLTTLQIAQSFHFIKDKSHVYYRDCEGGGCDYELLKNANPSTFQIVSTTSEDGLEKIVAKDAEHTYVCTESPISCDETD